MCHTRRVNDMDKQENGQAGFRIRIHTFPILSKNLALFPFPKPGRRFVQSAPASTSQYK